MKNKTTYLLLLFVTSIFLSSCVQDQEQIEIFHYTDEEVSILSKALNLPAIRDNYTITFPSHMIKSGLRAPNIDDAKATLGRVLFYDKKISKNNSVSCASCHEQALAFADAKALSEGFDGQLTKRNSLALASVVNFPTYYGGSGSFTGGTIVRPRFFWDERAGTVAEQSTMTIQDNIEMGMDLDDLANKVADVDYYQVLFKKAYGDNEITKETVLDAVQEFVNSFVSADSKFDKEMNKYDSPSVNFSGFTATENAGKSLFLSHCASCHSADMTTPVETTANNGLDMVSEDKGLYDFTNNPSDQAKFKVPPLRNIEFSGPYMHDGRFNTLEEVVEHYNSGIQKHPHLDSRLKGTNDEPILLNLTESEKGELVAYMKTFTDNAFLSAEKYSDPFQ